jgi:hypothetical protein
MGEVIGLSDDAELAASSRAKHCPAVLAVVAYPGWRSPGCPCVPCRRRGPRSEPGRCRVRGLAPEELGEIATAVEAAGRSGAAPEMAGSKHTAPEQGLSYGPVKKARVRSKM